MLGSTERRSAGEAAVVGGGVVGVVETNAVEGLELGDVGVAQAQARAEVAVVVGGRGVGVVVREAEDVSGLVQHEGEQVVGLADVLGAVEDDVAGLGAREGRVGRADGQVLLKQRILPHRTGGQANVAEPRIALQEPGGAEGLPAVGDEADVDVGVDGPGLDARSASSCQAGD